MNSRRRLLDRILSTAKSRRVHPWTLGMGGMIGAALCVAVAGAEPFPLAKKPKPQLTTAADASGVSGTLNLAGPTDLNNPFFQELGTNGRLCFTCHDPAAGGSITPTLIQQRFDATDGQDPLFRPVDGSVSPQADVSTLDARRQAYKLLLTRGLIRVGLPMPTNAEFTLDSVQDPYGFASANELSLFRRSLPAVNLPFLTTVMWDGRQTHAGFTLAQNLAFQAADATSGHAQGTVRPSDATLAQIVQFETGLFHAQTRDAVAGPLDGPTDLAKLPFYPGINHAFQRDPKGRVFNPNVFKMYTAWAKPAKKGDNAQVAAKKAIGRGEKLFNTLQFNVRDVAGLNDVLGKPVIVATCSSCHNTPSVGGGSMGLMMDIGVGLISPTQPKDLPIYQFRNTATGDTRSTADPGLALLTGKWSDIGKFKTPGLRGLAARAPYFHDGSAATLEDVLHFYDSRFGIGLGPQDVSDLAAFLRAL